MALRLTMVNSMTSQETKSYLQGFVKPLVQKRKRKADRGGLFSPTFRTNACLKTGMYVISGYKVRVWNESNNVIMIDIADLKSFQEYEPFKE
jgi:hypothetical protein